jgi:hypothetical protein
MEIAGIFGELGGIDLDIRQLIRTHPLEVEQFVLPNGKTLTIPTIAEILRITIRFDRKSLPH